MAANSPSFISFREGRRKDDRRYIDVTKIEEVYVRYGQKGRSDGAISMTITLTSGKTIVIKDAKDIERMKSMMNNHLV